MFYKKPKKILLVSPDQTLNKLFDFPDGDNKFQVFNVASCGKVFAMLFDKQPEAIVFDYNFMNKETEHILRRIRSNPFYNRLKIYCYKNEEDQSTDRFLKALGVDTVIYKKDVEKETNENTITKNGDGILRLFSLNVAFR